MVLGHEGGAVVRTLASHQCGTGSNPRINAIRGLSLLLVLSFALSGFSPGTPLSPLLRNQQFHIPPRPGMVNEEPLCGCAITKSKSLFREAISFKLQIK